MSILSIILLSVVGLAAITHFIHLTPPLNAGDPVRITEDSPEVFRAVDALRKTMVKAWNAGDGSLYASVFTGDADYIAFNGEWLRGRKEIMDSHQQLFEGPLKGSRFEKQQIISIRLISDQTALCI